MRVEKEPHPHLHLSIWQAALVMTHQHPCLVPRGEVMELGRLSAGIGSPWQLFGVVGLRAYSHLLYLDPYPS